MLFVSCCSKAKVGHSTATCVKLWQVKILGTGRVWALRIHGCLVVIPIIDNNIVVLHENTGLQLYTLPTVNNVVFAVCALTVDGFAS